MTITQEQPESRLTQHDLDNCGWEAVLDPVQSTDPRVIGAAFRVASGTCASRSEAALRLLCEVLELHLQPDKPGGPYFPSIRVGNLRAFLPEDLDEHELRALADFGHKIDFPALSARILDLAWRHPTTKHLRHAEGAIGAFTTGPIDSQSWSNEHAASWLRAIQVAKELGKGGKLHLEQLFQRLLEVVRRADASHPKFLRDIVTLLSRDPNRRTYAPEVARALGAVAESLLVSNEFHWASYMHLRAAEWARHVDDSPCAATSLSNAAYAKVAEVDHISQNGVDPPSATPLLEDAIEILRDIPKKNRDAFRVEGRISECRKRLRSCQVATFDQMEPLSVEFPGASELAEKAKLSVRGKPLIEALKEFVSLHRVTSKSELLLRAEESGREFVFRKVMSSRLLAADGRTIAKIPPLPFETEATEERSRALHADVVQSLGLYQCVAVQVSILPAQFVLQTEHRLMVPDFLELCRHSPVVPRDRRRTVADGLYAGFVGDYRSSLYLLAPQLEHLVRVHIQARGGHTSTIAEGIEQEKGLSALMLMPEAKEIFGEDLGLELYVLFCDSMGPNLRNQVAHGLLSDSHALSTDSVYAWWFMLRLVVFSFLQAQDGPGSNNLNQ